MPRLRIHFLALAIILSPIFSSYAQDGILVNIRVSNYPYADSHIQEKLSYALSPFREVKMIETCQSDGLPLGLEQLVAFGKEHNVRFLAELSIDKMDLKRQKRTIIPLILFRYKVFGYINGTVRIVDVEKERIIQLENLKVDLKAAEQWQILDDDALDPNLNIAVDEKIGLFNNLEDEVARQFWEKVRRLTRGNSFGG